MAGAESNPDTETNGSVDHLLDEPTENGEATPAADGRKLSAAEKKKQRKKLRKLSKQAERAAQAALQTVGKPLLEQPAKQVIDDVEVEYVSAPREFEALAHQDPARLDDVDADMGTTAGLGATPGLGSGGGDWGDTPALGLGATPGLGLGPTPGLGLGANPVEDSKPIQSNPFEEFQRVFEKFASAEELTGTAPRDDDQEAAQEGEDVEVKQEEKFDADSDDDSDAGLDAEAKKSKRKAKLESRLKIAELKQACPRPEVVEVWDVTASDPRLLVFLKAYRNTVPVPRHWSQKRKYLQGKRGIEKPPFVLPDFIEATGIGQMRQAYQEKEESKKLKQKQRDKMQPKMGKLDIDYQVLHDAFFKHQTKPTLTSMGELYYEGKEFEAKVKNAKPGVLSEELREALGMAEGAPPPWLINMQRYGPPPSYPDLQIPGLSAPIPPGAQFGYQPGGWGKPPVDEDGNPLYGDVFAQAVGDEEEDDLVDKLAHWGDLESDEEEESSEEEEEEDEEDEEGAPSIDGYASVASGITSGLSSLQTGFETPEVINLRKGGAGEKQLFTVLEQQAAAVGTGALMGSDHTYVIPGGEERARRPLGAGAAKRAEILRKEAGAGDLQVAIDPEQLEGMTEEEVRAFYEQQVAEERARTSREDFSDMVARNAAQQKRKADAKASEKAAKKAKETFKF